MEESIPDTTSFSRTSYSLPKAYYAAGAIGIVSDSMLNSVAVASPDHALQGRVTGVWASQVNAMPAGSVSLWVRGGSSWASNHQPLYVIDGVPMYYGTALHEARYANPLSAITPYDIASIEIIKDATAARYGMRGINGVVLINTLSGNKGKPTVLWNSYVGWQQVTRTLPLMNARQHAAFLNEENQARGHSPLYTEATIDSLGKGTDWQDEILRTAPIHQNHVTVSGGGSRTQYAVSGSFFEQKGVVAHTDFNRYTLRANLAHFPIPRLVLQPQIFYSRSHSHLTPSGAITAALSFNPILPVRDTKGNYTLDNPRSNPVLLIEKATPKYELIQWGGRYRMTYQLIDSLYLNIQTGGSVLANQEIVPISYAAGFDAIWQQGIQESTWLVEPTFTYQQSFGKHQTHLSLGAAYQTFRYQKNQQLDSGSYEGIKHSQLTSPFIADLSYSYDHRYTLLFIARYDGSSKFIRQEKFGFFPAVAAAWHINEEPWARAWQTVDQLTLRASYGITGSEILPAVESVFLFTGGTRSSIKNFPLSYERNEQWNIGLSGTLGKERLQFIIDAFRSTSSDLLLAVPTPLPSGFISTLRNVGRIQNQGLEVSLSSKILTGPLIWNSQVNFTTWQHTLVDVGPVDFHAWGNLSFIEQAHQLRKGAEMGDFYGYIAEGVLQHQQDIDHSAQPFANPGDIQYRDVSGAAGEPDHFIDTHDRTVIGNAIPTWVSGMDHHFSWKDWSMDILLYASVGNQVLNAQRAGQWIYGSRSNQQVDILERWTPNRTTARFSTAGYRSLSNIHVEDASFLRCRALSLAYQMPLHSNHTEVKVYISAQNLFTVTPYGGYDPEVNYYGIDGTLLGVDYDSYPRARTFLLGFQVRLH